MKISKSYFNFDDEYSSSSMEISERSLNKIDCQCSSRLLPLESQSHRHYGKINHSSFVAPKRCHVSGEQYSELAFSILQYQLKDEQTKATHFNNLKHNLERRMQAAKAQGNEGLVALLTQESRQIASF
jgi:hypothetical protein